MDTFFKFFLKVFSIVFRVKYPVRPIHGIVLYASIYGNHFFEITFDFGQEFQSHERLWRKSREVDVLQTPRLLSAPFSGHCQVPSPTFQKIDPKKILCLAIQNSFFPSIPLIECKVLRPYDK